MLLMDALSFGEQQGNWFNFSCFDVTQSLFHILIFYHAEVLNIWNVYNFSLGFIVMQELHFLLGSSCAMKRTLSSTSLDFVIMLRKSVF